MLNDPEVTDELDLPETKFRLAVGLLCAIAVSSAGAMVGWFMSGLTNCHIAFMVGPGAGAAVVDGTDMVMAAIWMVITLGPLALFSWLSKKRGQRMVAGVVALLLGTRVFYEIVDSWIEPLAYWQQMC